MSSKHISAHYEVTHDGRVLSKTLWRGIEVRELAQFIHSDGYLCVRCVVDGKRRRLSVHRLVAQVHLGPQPAPGQEVRHLDGNKLNNHVSNLAWGSTKENAADRDRHGRTSRGERHSARIRASNQAEGTREFRRKQRATAGGAQQ